MAATTIAESAADLLLLRKEELAQAITRALYAAMPELHQKYGEAGREKCLQDLRYNLEHLAPAVALSDPVLFARYARWLRELLAARGIPVDEVRRSFELTERTVSAGFPEEEAALVARALHAGIEALAEASLP